MAGGAADLAEKLTAALYILVIQVTCGRYGQAAVPDHQVGILFIAHFNGKVLGHQEIVDIGLHVTGAPSVLGFGILGLEVIQEGIEAVLNIGILGSSSGVCRGHIVVAAVYSGSGGRCG